VQYQGDDRGHERLLLAKKTSQLRAVARPAGMPCIDEDLLANEAVAVSGARGGLPRGVRGRSSLRFNEDELDAREAELLAEGATLVKSGRDTSVPQRRLPGKHSFKEALALGAPPPAGRAPGAKPVLPLARVPAAVGDCQVWVCAEQQGVLDIGDPLPPSALIECNFGDCGVAMLRTGTAVAVVQLRNIELATGHSAG
jgi:hypothetical protein